MKDRTTERNMAGPQTPVPASRRRAVWFFALGLAGAAGAATLALSPDSAAHGDDGPNAFERRCVGTYLVLEEATGAQTLWTFHRDRTLIASSTGENVFAFSGQQGSWRPEGGAGARAVELVFDWDAAGALEAIGRVDIVVSAADSSCDTLTGSFEGRLFVPGEDPLDITDVPPLYGDTIVGQRVRVP
jgi:hypothetical protein